MIVIVIGYCPYDTRIIIRSIVIVVIIFLVIKIIIML